MAGLGVRAVSGVAAAGLGVGLAELASALFSAGHSPLTAIGSLVVDHTPDGIREWAITTFGTNDKTVLFLGMGVVMLIAATVAGIVEQPGRPVGSLLWAGFGVFGIFATITRAGASWLHAAPTALGAVAAITALRILTGTRHREEPADSEPKYPHRRLLGQITFVGLAAVTTGVAGRVLGTMLRDVSGERATVTLPTPVHPLPPLRAGEELSIPGLTPFVTANSDFYRIDTALTVPQLSIRDWELRIHGLVEREITLSYADLARLPAIEKMVTLTCVSNPVGGNLIGNARWLGYRSAQLLAEARPHPDADMVLSRSIDGFTASTPLSALTDDREALLAVGMNGEPLPASHGYPARLVVPGLYGYVSATKWVVELEVTRFDRAQAYWTQRGWSAEGPIKTECRIDTPASGAHPPSGRIPIAGIAWAPHRGIDKVEVQIDGGPWRQTELGGQPTNDSWRQWVYYWDASPGPHTLRARATDGTGTPQTATVADVIPDGATGIPSVTVTVR